MIRTCERTSPFNSPIHFPFLSPSFSSSPLPLTLSPSPFPSPPLPLRENPSPIPQERLFHTTARAGKWHDISPGRRHVTLTLLCHTKQPEGGERSREVDSNSYLNICPFCLGWLIRVTNRPFQKSHNDRLYKQV